jgi:phage-related baseplate assembly protein
LKTALSDINVFTDDIKILDGLIRPINIESVIIVSRNVDASIVKENVDFAIKSVFDINNIQMGQGFYKSDLIKAITSVDGVKSVNLFNPADDFPPLRSTIDANLPIEDRPHAIGSNELYVLGSMKLQYYIESGNLNV